MFNKILYKNAIKYKNKNTIKVCKKYILGYMLYAITRLTLLTRMVFVLPW